MAKVELKVAAPSNKDFDAVYQFNRICESLTDGRGWYSVKNWKEWDTDDKDYKLLKKIEKKVCEEEDGSPENIDQRIVLWEYVNWFFNYCPSSLLRVVMCADMAMENAFDKKADCVEWNKKLLKIFDKADKYDELNKDKKIKCVQQKNARNGV